MNFISSGGPTLILLALFAATPLAAQEPVRQYATNDVMARLLRDHPAIAANRVTIEQYTRDFRWYGEPEQRTVPIVFHIVYSDAETRLAPEQINSQLEALNRDFSRQDYEADFSGDLYGFEYDAAAFTERERLGQNSADAQIRFCLADAGDPGMPGLHYVASDVHEWGSTDAIKRADGAGVPPWDPEHILNIWVARLADSVSGYAQMPGGPWESDGIVIDYRFFGTMGTARPPFDRGRTLTHLAGNYLNLFEIWGAGNCDDDGVDDTPSHNAPNYGCPHYLHVSLCDNHPAEMVMNFMDNTDDACQYLFTEGQKQRMQAVLADGGWRAALALSGDTHCGSAAAPGQAVERQTPDTSNTGTGAGTSLKAYPNPAHDYLYAEIQSTWPVAGELRVMDALGKPVYTGRPVLENGRAFQHIDCRTWPAGIYYVVYTGAGPVLTQKINIERL